MQPAGESNVPGGLQLVDNQQDASPPDDHAIPAPDPSKPAIPIILPPDDSEQIAIREQGSLGLVAANEGGDDLLLKPKAIPYSKASNGSESSLSSFTGSSRRSSQVSDEPPSSTAEEAAKPKRSKRRRSTISGLYSVFAIRNEHFTSRGKVSRRDGRLKIHIHEFANKGWISQILSAGIKNHLDHETKAAYHAAAEPPELVHLTKAVSDELLKPPKLNIVIMVIGSRGDIQPFIKIARDLKEQHGHRVRMATHPAFKDFIEKESGLEFFSIGGDPSELMAFMVKNPGLIPSLGTMTSGEVGRRRDAMSDMFQGMWRACINAAGDQDESGNVKDAFVADAIIANPPSFAHIHCAERLGCPLHIMFTFPYTPTQSFPHPLANIKSTNVDQNYTNYMSYPLVELMVWQGLGDLINRFRVKTLDLEPVSTLWAPGQLYRMKVPYTYMWSPALVPKPTDWGPEIDISGFVFLELASNFKPPPELQSFLDAGEPPVYIGFGSIVVDDPDGFTRLIFDAVKQAGVRALVSKGWGGLGAENQTPDNIYMLENTPHDWLFPRCSAVIHHGGAGTTAIGLKCAKPTMIVPFFGDQIFWGSMVAAAKAGAQECTPYKRLTSARLALGIQQCLSPEAQRNVQMLAESIANEGDGAINAVQAFHDHLPLSSLHCSLLPTRPAVWQLRHHHCKLHLSTLAAEILLQELKIVPTDLRLLRQYPWTDFSGPGAPITGALGVLWHSLVDVSSGVAAGSAHLAHDLKEHHAMHHASHSKEQEQEQQQAPDPNSSQQTRQQQTPNLETALITLLVLPSDLLLALCQGLHNMPRTLLGDDTVRPPPAVRGITSVRTGARAARSELVEQTRQAWWGVYGLPVRRVRRVRDRAAAAATKQQQQQPRTTEDAGSGAINGDNHTRDTDGAPAATNSTSSPPPKAKATPGALVLGALTGTAQGVAGLFIKQAAGIVGLPAYTLKGVRAAARRRWWRQLEPEQRSASERIREARGAQGIAELEGLLLGRKERDELFETVRSGFDGLVGGGTGTGTGTADTATANPAAAGVADASSISSSSTPAHVAS